MTGNAVTGLAIPGSELTLYQVDNTMQFPQLPSGEALPLEYRWIRSRGLVSLMPWEFYYNDLAIIEGWRRTYQENTGKDAWPFATRVDQLKQAAFPLAEGRTDGAVIVVDMNFLDTWAHGDKIGMTMEEFPSFREWLASALRDSFEIADEFELSSILEEPDATE